MPSIKGKPRDKKRGRPFDPTRRRFCHFCKEKIAQVDYKDATGLRRFISDRGKIKSPRVTGTCRRHQHQLATAIKRAREMALLPYVSEAKGVPERGGRRPR
ncbi:MAG: 30S ribosomal protein S18 [Thermoleophilia bacterium]